MTSTTRREFLTRGSAALSVPALRPSLIRVQRNGERGQYIIERSRHSNRYFERRGLEVRREFETVDLLAVTGPQAVVEDVTEWAAPDLAIQRSEHRPPHAPARRRRSKPSTDGQNRSNRPITGDRARSSDWYPVQWNKRVQGIEEIHDATQGEGARVAIIDSGIHTDHPDFRGDVVNERLSENFTPDDRGTGKAYGGGHGTAVGGYVAANGSILVGSAPAAELVDCRVFTLVGTQGGQPTTALSQYLAALEHAIQTDCHIVNMSLGPGVTTPVRTQALKIIEASGILERAAAADILVVTSAGNEAIDLRRHPLYKFDPGPNVMTVSATGPIGFGWPITDRDGNGFTDPSELEQQMQLQAPPHELAPYSSYGKGIVDISAPGGNIGWFRDGPLPDGYFLDQSPESYVGVSYDGTDFSFDSLGLGWGVGTSYAAPEVAGAAALIKGAYPDVTANRIKTELQRTARDVGRESPDPLHGAGFLNPAPLF
jgi:subtilisin family serine protease